MHAISYPSRKSIYDSCVSTTALRFMPSERDVSKALQRTAVQLSQLVGPGEYCYINRRAKIDNTNKSDTAELALFGLIPSWACDSSSAQKNCVAHLATIKNKPTYLNSLRNAQFCWLAVDYFLGSIWKDGREIAVRVEKLDQTPLYLAGIWSEWTLDSKTPVLSFCLLTRDSDAQLKRHGVRLGQGIPQSYVFLNPIHLRDWLNGSFEQNNIILEATDTAELLINPYLLQDRPCYAT